MQKIQASCEKDFLRRQQREKLSLQADPGVKSMEMIQNHRHVSLPRRFLWYHIMFMSPPKPQWSEIKTDAMKTVCAHVEFHNRLINFTARKASAEVSHLTCAVKALCTAVYFLLSLNCSLKVLHTKESLATGCEWSKNYT